MSISPTRRARCIGLLFISLGVLSAGSGCDDGAKAKPDAAGAAPAATTASTAAALAEGKLAGLYIRQQMVPMAIGGRMTFNLQREFFYFFPDGHVLFGVPEQGALKEHPTADDYATFKDVDPKLRGTYVVKAGQITFTPEKGTATTEPFSIPKAGDDSVLQIGETSVVGSVKAAPFKEGQALDGSYQFDGSVGLGGPNTIFNVTTLTFHPDGTLGSAHLGGIDTQGTQTAAGSSGVTTHANDAAAGTYRFNGYTLETTLAGKTEKATAFHWSADDKPAAPGLICIAARVYSLQEPKK